MPRSLGLLHKTWDRVRPAWSLSQPIPALAIKRPVPTSCRLMSVPRRHITRNFVRKRKSPAPVIIGLVILILAGGAWGYFQFFMSNDQTGPLRVEPVADQNVPELESVEILVQVDGADARNDLAYALIEAPLGASIDDSGRLQWVPSEDQGPGRHLIRVRVSVEGDSSTNTEVEFAVDVTEENSPPNLLEIQDVAVEAGNAVEFQVYAADPDIPAVELAYSLGAEVPAGASIDAQTGEFEWTVDADYAGQSLEIPIHVAETGENGLTTTETVTVVVSAPSLSPVGQLAEALRDSGDAVEIVAAAAHELPFTGEHQLLNLSGQEIHVFEYALGEDLVHDLDQVSTENHALFGKPWEQESALTLFRNDSLIAAYSGTDSDVRQHLAAWFGRVFAEVTKMPVPEAPQRSPLIETLIGLYEERNPGAQKERMLFSLREYETVRKAFSDDFERQYDFEIHSAFGDGYDEMMEWLGERPELKEELFTAFRPEFDDVVAGLTLFRVLRERFPEAIERYGSLAIATAVTWDKERPGVYDYEHHARRTKSKMPANLLDGIDNFDYLVSAEDFMQGRILHVPWEFLTLVINHKTPGDERAWAMRNYVGERVMFGECYSDVPYDTQMLETSSEVCLLADKDYTLPNIRQFGGVCAMQADFAARVGQSIGVPAAYVTGPNRYGGLHAWVMWVELKAVSDGEIKAFLSRPDRRVMRRPPH